MAQRLAYLSDWKVKLGKVPKDFTKKRKISEKELYKWDKIKTMSLKEKQTKTETNVLDESELSLRNKLGFGFGHFMNDLCATMWFRNSLWSIVFKIFKSRAIYAIPSEKKWKILYISSIIFFCFYENLNTGVSSLQLLPGHELKLMVMIYIVSDSWGLCTYNIFPGK